MEEIVISFLNDIAFSEEGKEFISDQSKINFPALFVKYPPQSMPCHKSVLTAKLIKNQGKRKNCVLEPVPETDPNHFLLTV